jgi:hypothetical protein
VAPRLPLLSELGAIRYLNMTSMMRKISSWNDELLPVFVA